MTGARPWVGENDLTKFGMDDVFFGQSSRLQLDGRFGKALANHRKSLSAGQVVITTVRSTAFPHHNLFGCEPLCFKP